MSSQHGLNTAPPGPVVGAGGVVYGPPIEGAPMDEPPMEGLLMDGLPMDGLLMEGLADQQMALPQMTPYQGDDFYGDLRPSNDVNAETVFIGEPVVRSQSPDPFDEDISILYQSPMKQGSASQPEPNLVKHLFAIANPNYQVTPEIVIVSDDEDMTPNSSELESIDENLFKIGEPYTVRDPVHPSVCHNPSDDNSSGCMMPKSRRQRKSAVKQLSQDQTPAQAENASAMSSMETYTFAGAPIYPSEHPKPMPSLPAVPVTNESPDLTIVATETDAAKTGKILSTSELLNDSFMFDVNDSVLVREAEAITTPKQMHYKDFVVKDKVTPMPDYNGMPREELVVDEKGNKSDVHMEEDVNAMLPSPVDQELANRKRVVAQCKRPSEEAVEGPSCRKKQARNGDEHDEQGAEKSDLGTKRKNGAFTGAEDEDSGGKKVRLDRAADESTDESSSDSDFPRFVPPEDVRAKDQDESVIDWE